MTAQNRHRGNRAIFEYDFGSEAMYGVYKSDFREMLNEKSCVFVRIVILRVHIMIGNTGKRWKASAREQKGQRFLRLRVTEGSGQEVG